MATIGNSDVDGNGNWVNGIHVDDRDSNIDGAGNCNVDGDGDGDGDSGGDGNGDGNGGGAFAGLILPGGLVEPVIFGLLLYDTDEMVH